MLPSSIPGKPPELAILDLQTRPSQTRYWLSAPRIPLFRGETPSNVPPNFLKMLTTLQDAPSLRRQRSQCQASGLCHLLAQPAPTLRGLVQVRDRIGAVPNAGSRVGTGHNVLTPWPSWKTPSFHGRLSTLPHGRLWDPRTEQVFWVPNLAEGDALVPACLPPEAKTAVGEREGLGVCVHKSSYLIYKASEPWPGGLFRCGALCRSLSPNPSPPH